MISCSSFRHIVFFSGIVVFFLLLSWQPVIAQQKVLLATGEYPPEHSERLKNYGALSQVITEAFSLEDITVEWNFFPWPRAIHYAETGIMDGVASPGYSESRAEKMIKSDPLYTSATRFYHLKTLKLQWNEISDLQGLSIGATISYNYGKVFNAGVRQGFLSVDTTVSDILNFRKLLIGRIDAFSMTTGVAEYLLRNTFSKEEIEKITYHPKPLRLYDSFLWLSKKNENSKQILEKFNKGLKTLRVSGRYQEIFEQWGYPAELDY